jgi:hypothetical protein
MEPLYIVLGIVVAALAVSALAIQFIRTFRTYAGTRVITCPRDLESAAVRINAFLAARRAAVRGTPEVRLSSCTFWPERAGCGQQCLAQIENTPDGCRLKSLITAWYADKRCVYCFRRIGPVVWHDRPPALRSAEKATVEWTDIPAQEVPKVLQTHEAVCWKCHVVESFRREHANLVIDRPEHKAYRA